MTPSSLNEHDARRYVRAALSETDDDWTLILTNHGKDQMAARDVSDLRMRSVLRHGQVTEGPYQDAGNWKCNFTGTANGGLTVVVGFAFDEVGSQAVVVTVIDLSN